MEMTYHKDPGGFGLRKVKILREGNGFGFTLRHFIVYPPDVYSNGFNDDERNRKVIKVTEPVDTIFVRSVVENGPAERAGLSVGDRIVSVNGKTIFGTSYDTVVQLIQKSPDFLSLEVSPKQYDTLQLFFEETAYRPETNQRPYQNSLGNSHFSDQVSYRDFRFSNSLYPPHNIYNNYSNTSTDSFYLNNTPSHHGSMSSPSHPNSSGSNIPQLLSHLPRPTPYKSSSAWTTSSTAGAGPSHHPQVRPLPSQTKSQPQAYYPFVQDQSLGGSNLWKIKEEANPGVKSAESIHTKGCNPTEFMHYADGTASHRTASMECLTGLSAAGQSERVSGESSRVGVRAGQRPVPSYDNYPASSSSSSQRRESTGSIPNSNVQNTMVVTITSTTNSKDPASYQPELSDSGSSLGGYNNSSSIYSTPGQEYEHKIADRIRRSCEQKEEFLKRPNQPLIWAPSQSAGGSFPKELYAQPQKFEKIPWPPEHRLATVTLNKPPLIQSCYSSSGSFDSQIKNISNVSVVNVQHYNPSPSSSNRTKGVSVDEYDCERACTSLSQIQISSPQIPHQPRSLSPSWLEYAPRNRTTIVGSSKLHCDPPQGWTPSDPSLVPINEASQGSNQQLDEPDSSNLVVEGAGGEVRLRHRDNDDLADETERLVRRVSYLRATSSPIDMDRKSTSPGSPTKTSGGRIEEKATSNVVDLSRRRSVANKLSAEFFPKGRIIRLKQFFEDRTQPNSIFKFNIDSPTTEYRGFGTLAGIRNADNTEVTRDGQIHYKIRLGESKKGGYNRSWRQGWAQVRKSGYLYISKEQLSRESVTISEDAVILALSLRSGVTVEQADDYSKRKYRFRIKTSYSSLDITNTVESGVTNPPNAHPPSHSTQVEILVQTDDANDFDAWLHCIHTQLENNNYSNGNAANYKGIFFGPEFCPRSKSSLLTSFLPSPAVVTQSSDRTPAQSASASSGSSGLQVNAVQSAASPKNKTWKGKVARQWKRVHNIIESGNDSKGSHPYSSLPPAGATFGISLENCPPGENNPLIPRVIEYAIELVEGKGIDMVGLYRIPGNNASVTTLIDRLNKGEEPNPEKDPKWLDVHVVASLIKSFLRKLPDPLLTDERYPAFIIAVNDTEEDKCLERMQLLINDLPDANYETLRAVIMHLKNVAQHGESNRMDSRNLAIVFGPTIVRAAEESVTIMVQDMKNQCKIVELLISNADELFTERRVKNDYPPQNIPVAVAHTPNPQETYNLKLQSTTPNYNLKDAIRLPCAAAVQLYKSTDNPPITVPPASPTIENELKTSLVQAALRKVSQSSAESRSHNVYGLPTKPTKKGKPIDDAGFIRSYAGLNEETEQRVRKFELETRAMLCREDRSPYSSAVNVGGKSVSGIRMMNLDDELQKAKDDLENEDIYDQLADNPSSIIHHRDRGTFSVSSGQRNLSSSSISSSNSNGTVPFPFNPHGIAQKLGPTPFKPMFPSESLPPKPPTLHHSGSSVAGPSSIPSKSSLSSSPASPLRRFSSMERFGGSDVEGNRPSLAEQDSRKTSDGGGQSTFIPNTKYFGGSLDSLKDISQIQEGHRNNSRHEIVCQDFPPRSSMGSNSKHQKLRSSPTSMIRNPKDINKSNTETVTKANQEEIDTNQQTETSANEPKRLSKRLRGNGFKKNFRRNSMIERKANRDVAAPATKEITYLKDEDYYGNFNLHRLTGSDLLFNKMGSDNNSNVTKAAKTTTKTKGRRREFRRRHSLSGGGDILKLLYHDKSMRYFDDSDPPSEDIEEPVTNLDCTSTTNNNTRGLLESHV